MGVACLMAGYIKLFRGWDDACVFKDEPRSEREAWLWLIENAAWKSGTRLVGKGTVVNVERGQIHLAERTLARVWGWDRKRVSRYLKRLESALMITPQGGPLGTLVTICNYEKFQGRGATNGATNGATQEEREEQKKGIKHIKPRASVCPDDFWPEPKPGSKTAKAIAQWSADRLESEVERFIAHHQEKGTTSPNWNLRFTTWALSSYQANTKGKSNGKRYSTGSLSGPASEALDAVTGYVGN